MIKIKICARKRELTSFNPQTKKINKELAHYPVMLYFYDRGMKYYVTTDLVTTNADMQDTNFKDADQTQTVNLRHTYKLTKIVTACYEYAEKNPHKTAVMMKKIMNNIVKAGGDMDATITDGRCKLVKAIDDYVESQELSASTKDMYQSLKQMIGCFDKDVTFAGVDIDWLRRFEKYLKIDRENKTNTIAMRMRCLRAVFKWGGKQSVGLTNNRVFEDYSIKSEVVTKTALTAQQLADFRDYPVEEWQEKYRDLAMLSFYLAGTNAGDLLKLREMVGGRISYGRTKTGADINLPLVDEAKEIIWKYKGRKFLLRFMDELTDGNYKQFLKQWNECLKKIGLVVLVKDKAGKKRKMEYHPLHSDMSTYTMRYSFATIASEIGIETEDIGKCLGHSWATKGNVTLERYIKRQQKNIDSAIEKVAEYMRGIKGRQKSVIDAEIRKRDKIKCVD